MCRINHHAQRAGTHRARKLRQGSLISLSIRLGLGCVRCRWHNHQQTPREGTLHRRLERSLLGIGDLAPVTCEHL